jgi:high-affinity Fe2+/Pb2+ permease
MPKTSLGWLIVGAVAGFALVLFAGVSGLLSMSGWTAALATTVCATVVGGVGPLLRREAEVAERATSTIGA